MRALCDPIRNAPSGQRLDAPKPVTAQWPFIFTVIQRVVLNERQLSGVFATFEDLEASVCGYGTTELSRILTA